MFKTWITDSFPSPQPQHGSCLLAEPGAFITDWQFYSAWRPRLIACEARLACGCCVWLQPAGAAPRQHRMAGAWPGQAGHRVRLEVVSPSPVIQIFSPCTCLTPKLDGGVKAGRKTSNLTPAGNKAGAGSGEALIETRSKEKFIFLRSPSFSITHLGLF